MSAEPPGRVLIASNRGPVSFSLGNDGKLTSRRGGGGVVAGLSAVAGRAEVLWVCAALNDADRAAARAVPDGRLDVSLSADGEGRWGPEAGAEPVAQGVVGTGDAPLEGQLRRRPPPAGGGSACAGCIREGVQSSELWPASARR